MNFQDLTYHLEEHGCTLDHFHEDSYYVTNCVSSHVCLIENLDNYLVTTLCHYFYELKVPAPADLDQSMESYKEFRENLDKEKIQED